MNFYRKNREMFGWFNTKYVNFLVDCRLLKPTTKFWQSSVNSFKSLHKTKENIINHKNCQSYVKLHSFWYFIVALHWLFLFWHIIHTRCKICLTIYKNFTKCQYLFSVCISYDWYNTYRYVWHKAGIKENFTTFLSRIHVIVYQDVRSVVHCSIQEKSIYAIS
mgnify:CR=1 FL=1